jgi:hypothetical protein
VGNQEQYKLMLAAVAGTVHLMQLGVQQMEEQIPEAAAVV